MTARSHFSEEQWREFARPILAPETRPGKDQESLRPQALSGGPQGARSLSQRAETALQ